MRSVYVKAISFFKNCYRFLAFFTCEAKLHEYRYVQLWIIVKGWKQSPVGWFLESLKKTLSF